MADTATLNLAIARFEAGGHQNTWGDDFNTAILDKLDAVAGNKSLISTTGGTVTVSDTQVQSAGLALSGTLASDAVIQMPQGRARAFIIENALVLGTRQCLLREGVAGATIALPVGRYLIWFDGTGLAPHIVCRDTDPTTIPLLAGGALSAAPVNVTANATTNIGAAASHIVNIVGNTTITAFDVCISGTIRFCRIIDGLTLTQSAGLQLIGGKSIVATTGDCGIFLSLGSGNWVQIAWNDFTGTPFNLTDTETTIVGGTTVDLNVQSNAVFVTGTATCSSFGANTLAGKMVVLRFADTTTLVQSASMNLPNGGSNIVTATNDTAIARCRTPGVWDVIAFQRKAGGALASVATTTVANIWANSGAGTTLTPDVLWGSQAEVTLPFSTSMTPDLGTFINAVIGLTGNLTLNNVINGKVGQSGCIRLIQDGTGSRIITWGVNYYFDGGANPVLSTAANSIDALFYYVVSPTLVLCSILRGLA